jgi:hypothetical protein
VSSLISKTGAVTFVESTIGWLMSGFSERQKKLLSSFGLKSVLVVGVLTITSFLFNFVFFYYRYMQKKIISSYFLKRSDQKMPCYCGAQGTLAHIFILIHSTGQAQLLY